MIVTVASSLILMKKRAIMEVFPPRLRKLWKQWELRAMILLSLLCQIILIIFGNRRKCSPNTLLKCVVWSAYLLADSLATMGLGILLNDLGEVYEHGIDSNIEITAFWAPFLLLHLGGPDTITAYALEDNELYLRHAFQLVFQTLATVLIFFTAWNGSPFSALAIPMIFVGCIKYVERTWTLWSVSSDRLRDSMLTPADAGPNYAKFMDEYCLKHTEGYFLEAKEMTDAPADRTNISLFGDKNTSNEDEKHIRQAYELFRKFKCLFADLILSPQEHEISRSLLKDMSAADVFDVIAIELGFMYDLLYTKATVIYTPPGLVRRFITIVLTGIVLGLFSFIGKQKYSTVDIYITFGLLIIAVLLEIYAALVLLLSDQSKNWLVKHGKTVILKPIQWLEPLIKEQRWSNFIGQYSFTSFCLEEEPGWRIISFFCLDKIGERHRYKSHIQMPEEHLRQLILDHVKSKHQFKANREKQGNDIQLGDLYTKGSRALEINRLEFLEWSVKAVEFDQSILIWHIATELCYNSDTQDNIIAGGIKPKSKTSTQDSITIDVKSNPETSTQDNNNPGDIESNPEMSTQTDNNADETKSKLKPSAQDDKSAGEIESIREICKHLSQYMLYILVMYPFLLPVGIGLIRFRDTICEARKFLEERKSIYCLEQTHDNTQDRDEKLKKRLEASTMLLQVKTYVLPMKVKGDRSKSVLFDACRLASALNEIPDKKKWETIRDVWIEMLTYAASQSRGSQHGRQLRRGGELLTHVWLLMAHFGLTQQFQISKGHARAHLIGK